MCVFQTHAPPTHLPTCASTSSCSVRGTENPLATIFRENTLISADAVADTVRREPPPSSRRRLITGPSDTIPSLSTCPASASRVSASGAALGGAISEDERRASPSPRPRDDGGSSSRLRVSTEASGWGRGTHADRLARVMSAPEQGAFFVLPVFSPRLLFFDFVAKSGGTSKGGWGLRV